MYNSFMDLAKRFPKKVKTKKAREVTLRIPDEGDVKEMQRFINELVEEDSPILKNEKIKLTDEKKYLEGLLKEIKSKKSVNVYAFYKSKLIANTGVKVGKFRGKHMGNLGISVSKDFRDEGLGQLLMKELLFLAKNYLNLKKVTLSVLEGNPRGIHLYKKLGFSEYGKLPKAALYKGDYVDEILMYKDL